ncbi:MAG: peptidylprolyl isomerase, partial [Xanthomonadales bacterium]|nr:peptidylprolyl isomerase [Xanthomonadales bacterium]
LESRLQADPAKFDELVTEYSDDPAKINNDGRYREMRPGMMVAPFEKAAFALQEPGEISDPVQTDYGFHIIRLNGRSGNELQEFSAVKEEAMAEARQRHLDSYRESYYRRVLSDPIVVPEGAVEIMARRHFGENLELAPGGSQ